MIWFNNFASMQMKDFYSVVNAYIHKVTKVVISNLVKIKRIIQLVIR